MSEPNRLPVMAIVPAPPQCYLLYDGDDFQILCYPMDKFPSLQHVVDKVTNEGYDVVVGGPSETSAATQQ